MLNTETGIPVKGYENLYEVSNLGRVSNYRKVLKTYTLNSGYLAMKLVKDGGRKSVLLHRLVAEHFIPNPENKLEVNHINGDKTDNRVENLEWVTSSENKKHALNTGLKEYNIPTKGQKLGNSSQYHNVTWDKARSKWKAHIRHENKNWFPKRFDTELEAARHVNWILDELGLTDRPRNPV